MKARLRVSGIAAAGLLAAAPLLAQESPQNTTAPAQNEVVGPPQLRDFSLNGSVTSPAPQAAPAQPRARQPAEQRTASPAPRPAPAPETETADRRVSEPSLEPSTAASELALPAPSYSAPPPDSTPVPPATEPAGDLSQSGVAILPWLLAGLALAGTTAWFFLRRRTRERYATAGKVDLFEAPAPTPAPAPPPPVQSPPAQSPPKAVSTGIVSTRLRPWIELEFHPQRAVVDNDKAAVAFELSVYNSGSVPARDVLIEASLFNAGPMQDQQIKLFFDNPLGKGDRIPVIPPLQRVAVNTAVFLPRNQVRPIEIEGRLLFVPMIAFNALYAWSAGSGQTSASYLVGKTTKSEKLAPFRLELGPRIFRNLEAREHELRLRR